jgi:hypothetical protein
MCACLCVLVFVPALCIGKNDAHANRSTHGRTKLDEPKIIPYRFTHPLGRIQCTASAGIFEHTSRRIGMASEDRTTARCLQSSANAVLEMRKVQRHPGNDCYVHPIWDGLRPGTNKTLLTVNFRTCARLNRTTTPLGVPRFEALTHHQAGSCTLIVIIHAKSRNRQTVDLGTKCVNGQIGYSSTKS